MRSGGIVAQGAPEDVITTEALAEVFDLDTQVLIDPLSRRPLVVPIGQHIYTKADPL